MNLFKATFGTPNERFVFIDADGELPQFLEFFENREKLIEDNFFQTFVNAVRSEEEILEKNLSFILESVDESGYVRNIELMEVSVIPKDELEIIKQDTRFACDGDLIANEDEEISTPETIAESYSEEDLVENFDEQTNDTPDPIINALRRRFDKENL